MKISNIQYAKTLVELTTGKNEIELQQVLEQFALLLERNSDTARIEAIMSEFEKTWDDQEGLVEANVTSAQELEAETLVALKAYILEQTGAKEVRLKTEISEEVLAGFVLRFRDQVIDASAASQIGKLKSELTK